METRRKFFIVPMRSVLEPNGTPALPIEEETASEQQILVSRSCPDLIHDPEVIGQAVTDFAQRAWRRLRKEGEVTGRIPVFSSTSPHQPRPTHNVSAHVRLAVPTGEPAPLVTAARAAPVPTLLHGMSGRRAGILCLDLARGGAVPLLPGLLKTPAPLGELIDGVNRWSGARAPGRGGVGANAPAPWRNQQDDLSPRYTTEWDEMRTVA